MQRAAPLGERERRALRAELKQLEVEELPGAEDFEALLSPPGVSVAWARRVRGHSLWVLYRVSPSQVALHELARRMPTRVEE